MPSLSDAKLVLSQLEVQGHPAECETVCQIEQRVMVLSQCGWERFLDEVSQVAGWEEELLISKSLIITPISQPWLGLDFYFIFSKIRK